MSTETQLWLERLYGRSPGYFTLTFFGKGLIQPTKWFATEDTAQAAAFIETKRDKYDVYSSVATYAERPRKGRGKIETAMSIPGFWADLDIGTEGHQQADRPNSMDEAHALSITEGMPELSALIHSGGGLQAYWLFDEPWVFADADDRVLASAASAAWQAWLIERGAALGVHVDNVGDLARIMRVPGTFNRKLLDRPRLAETRYLDGPTHSAVLLSALGPAERAQETTRDIGSPDGTWADILTPHGCTEIGPHPGGGTEWRRPGKTSGGISFVTDPYGVEVLVNYSSSWSLPTGAGQKLTKRRVWTHLNFDGDEKAARAAIDKLKGPSEREGIITNRIDWERAYNEAPTETDWLAEPVLEAGRQTVIYAKAKDGKSIFALELAVRIVREGRVVVYIDLENTRDEIVKHLKKMGVDWFELPDLHYWSFPTMDHLDSPNGGQKLVEKLQEERADLVIIDTTQRTVKGEENNNDTNNNFYKYTGMPLKAAGIALLKLDYPGKDESKGMRGGSSKAADVDYVWWMSADPEDKHNPRAPRRIVFERTHSRSQQGASYFVVMRTDDPVLHHEVVTDPEMFAADRSLAARCSDVALDWSTSRQVAESVCGGSPTTREVKNVRQAMEDNLAGLFERRDGPPVEYRAR